MKQAQLRKTQSEVELSAAQRQAVANLRNFYSEAQTAHAELNTLRESAELAADSLRLTNLRYQAGEATALEVVDAQNTTAAALIPVPVGWGFVYFILFLIRWVKRGFGSNKKPTA